MKLLTSLNASLSFALELVALMALAFWGFQIGSPDSSLAWFLAIAIPLFFALAWSYWAAPRSKHRLKGWKYVAYKFGALSACVYLFVPLGQRRAAVGLEALLVLNLLLPSID
jgi:hypothetical protein